MVLFGALMGVTQSIKWKVFTMNLHCSNPSPIAVLPTVVMGIRG